MLSWPALCNPPHGVTSVQTLIRLPTRICRPFRLLLAGFYADENLIDTAFSHRNHHGPCVRVSSAVSPPRIALSARSQPSLLLDSLDCLVQDASPQDRSADRRGRGQPSWSCQTRRLNSYRHKCLQIWQRYELSILSAFGMGSRFSTSVHTERPQKAAYGNAMPDPHRMARVSGMVPVRAGSRAYLAPQILVRVRRFGGVRQRGKFREKGWRFQGTIGDVVDGIIRDQMLNVPIDGDWHCLPCSSGVFRHVCRYLVLNFLTKPSS